MRRHTQLLSKCTNTRELMYKHKTHHNLYLIDVAFHFHTSPPALMGIRGVRKEPLSLEMVTRVHKDEVCSKHT